MIGVVGKINDLHKSWTGMKMNFGSPMTLLCVGLFVGEFFYRIQPKVFKRIKPLRKRLLKISTQIDEWLPVKSTHVRTHD